MSKDDEWKVSDLLDPKEPFVNDVQLARQMIDTLENKFNQSDHSVNPIMEESGYFLEVRTPKAAYEFIENTLSDWFETVAEIEKKRGNMPYLIDRSLYGSGKIEWNQGLRSGICTHGLEKTPLEVMGRIKWQDMDSVKQANQAKEMSRYRATITDSCR